jgi:diguanylate cyclase (GGDEF)-like protein
LIAILVATLPFLDTVMVTVTSFFPMYAAAMIVSNLLLAVLLLIKGHSEQNDGTIRLGSAYLFVGLVIILHAASFPGGLMPIPLIGTPQSSAWIWCSWHVGFGLAIMRYGQQTSRRTSVPRATFAAIASMVCVAVIATCCTDKLPTLLKDGHFVYIWPSVLPWAAAAVVAFLALASVVRRGVKTPEQLWLVVAMTASCLDVFLTTYGSARYTLGWYVAKLASMFTSISVLISFICDITRVYSEVAVNNQALQILARTDGLTGIANRRYFDELLIDEFRRACRQRLPLALVLLDIDQFKHFNDCYGHPGGDDCLRRVSAAVKSALRRPADLPARYGGEEIAVLLPGADIEGAMVIAERIRLAIECLGIEHATSTHGVVTVSAGAASVGPFQGDEAAADLVAAADAALYRAKKRGRNIVCASQRGDAVAMTTADRYGGIQPAGSH